MASPSSSPADLAGSEAAASGALRGSCAICQCPFTQSGKISALTCGHTFHFLCVTQWLGVKKECPNCRKKVTKTGLIEKLFFDKSSFDGNETKCEIDFAEKAELLSTELGKEKELSAAQKKHIEVMNGTVKALEKKVLREKERYEKEIPALKAQNRHLEFVAAEADGYRAQLEQTRGLLKVCEFYKILSCKLGEEKAEQSLSKYLKGNGAIDTERFFVLMKAQNKEISTKRTEAVRESERLRGEVRNLKNEAQKKEDVIEALRKEIQSLRQMANVDTPINKKLRSILMNNAVESKRVSMGFDRTNLMEETLVESNILDENRASSSYAASAAARGAAPQTFQPFSFGDDSAGDDSPVFKKLQSPPKHERFEDEDEDDEPIFRKLDARRKKRISSESDEMEAAAAASKVEEPDDSFTFDIPVPASVMRRTLAEQKAPNAKPKPVKYNNWHLDKGSPPHLPPSSRPQIPKLYPLKTITSSSSSSIVSSSSIGSNPLKRTQRQLDSITKKPAVKMARISSFFSRNLPTTKPDVVIID